MPTDFAILHASGEFFQSKDLCSNDQNNINCEFVSVCDYGLLGAVQLTLTFDGVVGVVRLQIRNPMTIWRDSRPHHLSPRRQQMELNQSLNRESFAWTLLTSVM